MPGREARRAGLDEAGWGCRDPYLDRAGALPLGDYVPLLEKTLVAANGLHSCKRSITRSEPDDDINYTVLALVLMEERGLDLSTAEVARAWLRLLPGGATFTAERAAYRTLLERADLGFPFGLPPRFELAECADNEWCEWIGAQIRADLYGWMCPGRPALAVDLARRDAGLSLDDLVEPTVAVAEEISDRAD